MLFRKISIDIKHHLTSDSDKIMVIEGARQIGKSYIIREVGRKVFKNFVEINFVSDDEGPQNFKEVRTTEDFYLSLSMVAGEHLEEYDNTLVFLDEIQHYPQYLTLLKFLRQDRRYHFIASGSMLGITLRTTTSIPIGSIIRKKMFQLDFEEFLLANDFGKTAIDAARHKFLAKESLSDTMHKQMLNLFKRYLLVGGMPDAVNTYLSTHNIVKVREIQDTIKSMYADDASKYEKDSGRNLMIRRIYDMIPSQMENKKKRLVAKDIQNIKGDRFARYSEEFEYLISSGITLDVHAIANPKYPLKESVQKNLLKLYLNDVGMLTSELYHNNIRPVLSDEKSINLGAVYENIVAQELKAHEHTLFYYDNRQRGEVDFLIDDYNSLTVMPIEVKSGKDYTVHSALDRLLAVPDYNIKKGIVVSNNQEVKQIENVLYLPVYYIMFIEEKTNLQEKDLYF